ncbi:MAG: alcohol dehydrogenase catalytic domain-containing protein, partial [Frankiaceae bacterium]|nr:alcohol dehydrogenase catalytic domain-containing protein [Frankiaceae bacterium]
MTAETARPTSSSSSPTTSVSGTRTSAGTPHRPTRATCDGGTRRGRRTVRVPEPAGAPVRATVFHGPQDVRVEQVPDPQVQTGRDAVVRVTHACVCGSDLWPYGGGLPKEAGTRIGHEFLGVVDAVGPDVTSVAVGDVVLSPFTWSCGSCEHCRRGLPSSCVRGGFFGGPAGDGGQGEAVRVPQADGTLVRLPAELAGAPRLQSVLPLTAVMPTGHHAAVSAGVE